MPTLIKRGRIWYSNFPIKRYSSSGEILRKKDGSIDYTRLRWPLDTDKQIAQDRQSALLKIRREADQRGVPFAAQYQITETSVSGGRFQQFRDKFLNQSKQAQKPKTSAAFKRAFTALEGHFPISHTGDITPALLDEAKVAWKAKGRGLYVINRDLRAIKTAMRKAEAWKLVEKHDWRSVKEFKEPKGRLHFHTAKDLKKLVTVCRSRPISPQWLTICLLGARAGLRREEMYWLEWPDIDFANNRIHIAPKDGWNPKDYERRWVPLFSDLRQHLAQIKRRAKSRWIIAQEGDRPALGSMTAYFGRLTRKAGLKGNLHTLRHTFASHLAIAGVPLVKIKAWMGHDSIETTEIYSHLMPVGPDEQDIERLPALR